MEFSTATTSELNTRLEHLQAEQLALRDRLEQIDRERGAIDILLNGQSPAEFPIVDANRVGRVHYFGPFAGRIRMALEHHGCEASPKELATFMQEQGYLRNEDWSSRSELVSAVNSELYRMAQSPNDRVFRVRRGVYSIRSETEGEDDPDT